jgi:membrane protein EpsK
MKSEEIQPQAQRSSPQLTEARQRLPINVLSKMTWLVLNVIVGMWYTPYLISHLGVAVYGLVPLASSVTSYMAILTVGLEDAISRFLTIDLVRGDVDAANRTFNTAIVSSLIVAAILLPIMLVVSWLAPQIFNVPLGYERDAQWLVLLLAVAFLMITFTCNFGVSSYAYYRFDLRLLVNVVRLVTRVGSIVFLFTVLSPQLWQVGVGVSLAATLYLLGHRALWRKLTPELKIRFNWFDLPLLKQFFGFSGWILVNMVGSMLFLNIDLIVANLVFGPEVAGRYGAVIILPGVLRTLVRTVNGVLTPIVMTLYAQNNLSGLVRFSRLSVKAMGLALALPIGLVCGLGRPLLAVWLGPEFSDLSWLVVALVGHLCVNVAVIPLFSLQVVTNNVRVPGIVTLVMGGANAALAVAFALWSGWGYISIAIAGAIVLTAKNTFFTPLYGARILKLPWWTFLPSLIAGVVGCLIVGAGTYWLSLIWTLTDWGQLALVGVITSGLYMAVAYFLGLSAGERHLLQSEIQCRIQR